MVDLHTHILPGIDDGPADMDGSLVLARELAAEGVETVAATPHLRGDHPGVVVGELAARTAALGERLAEAGVPLAVVPAAEVSLEWAQEATDAELGLASRPARNRRACGDPVRSAHGHLRGDDLRDHAARLPDPPGPP